MSPPRPRHLLLRPLLLLLLLLPVALALAAPKYDGVLRPQPDGSVVSYMVPHATPLHATLHDMGPMALPSPPLSGAAVRQQSRLHPRSPARWHTGRSLVQRRCRR